MRRVKVGKEIKKKKNIKLFNAPYTHNILIPLTVYRIKSTVDVIDKHAYMKIIN